MYLEAAVAVQINLRHSPFLQDEDQSPTVHDYFSYFFAIFMGVSLILYPIFIIVFILFNRYSITRE